MAKYRSPPPIGYRGPFRNMADIYKEYRNTLMNTGSYKAYFSSRASYGESPRKFTKIQYSGEQRPMSEPERKEQQNEIKPVKTDETKTEITKEDSQKIETPKETESSQKLETSQKSGREKDSESQDELSYEKLGPPYERNLGQTDITPRNRPSPYQDRAETRW